MNSLGRKPIHKYVSYVVHRGNKSNLKLFVGLLFTNKVLVDFDMLYSVMKNWVEFKGYSPNIVTPYEMNSGQRDVKITEERA